MSVLFLWFYARTYDVSQGHARILLARCDKIPRNQQAAGAYYSRIIKACSIIKNSMACFILDLTRICGKIWVSLVKFIEFSGDKLNLAKCSHSVDQI